ncbi:FAD-dependent monooxygenase [Parasphingorhabdus sp.]|uniref:FAD-dependent monooxygenase n=1 Tax=Parasphingorhabdus sp. TaxID=2709688 RepID=UPI0032664DF4
MKILIIGAGLGGLTAAIALRQQGIDVEVHEAANRLEETGAGLTLGLGAQHVFRALGVQGAVAARSCPAGVLPFLHYQNGRLLMGDFDHGDGRADDGEADIIRHIYRADLQQVLIDALKQLGGPIYTGHKLVDFDEADGQITARFADGALAKGDLLVGADGVRSAVRAMLRPGDEPRFTDHVAYRFLVPMREADPFMQLGRSAIFIGPERTFNRYTMCNGEIVNCAGLAETKEPVPEGWSTGASKSELAEIFAGWHEDVVGLIGHGSNIIKWGLYDRKPLAKWSRGRTTLLGDAAHAMLPFLGMGAAMAIEDGYILAKALVLDSDIDGALARYESARKPRTEKVHAASIIQGKVTQAIDPDKFKPASAPMNNMEMMAFNPVTATI